jgi:hypothetical protein
MLLCPRPVAGAQSPGCEAGGIAHPGVEVRRMVLHSGQLAWHAARLHSSSGSEAYGAAQWAIRLTCSTSTQQQQQHIKAPSKACMSACMSVRHAGALCADTCVFTVPFVPAASSSAPASFSSCYRTGMPAWLKQHAACWHTGWISNAGQTHCSCCNSWTWKHTQVGARREVLIHTACEIVIAVSWLSTRI